MKTSPLQQLSDKLVANNFPYKNFQHKETATGLQILISDQIKTSKINKAQPCIHIPLFVEKPNLCVANTIKHYKNVTACLRKDTDDFFILNTQKTPQSSHKTILKQMGERNLENGRYRHNTLPGPLNKACVNIHSTQTRGLHRGHNASCRMDK
ncbi:hypothetical protein NQ317_019463 [Molorchus minor]|uniref:Uncharacterized protein n=1 Tax=Molorchus minor TaxID=1323400 RepID=A0ABQ9IQQ9_9CUCU|nr:hypothetical protein NQ317_019463 [Molorchus minor]